MTQNKSKEKELAPAYKHSPCSLSKTTNLRLLQPALPKLRLTDVHCVGHVTQNNVSSSNLRFHIQQCMAVITPGQELTNMRHTASHVYCSLSSACKLRQQLTNTVCTVIPALVSCQYIHNSRHTVYTDATMPAWPPLHMQEGSKRVKPQLVVDT